MFRAFSRPSLVLPWPVLLPSLLPLVQFPTSTLESPSLTRDLSLDSRDFALSACASSRCARSYLSRLNTHVLCLNLHVASVYLRVWRAYGASALQPVLRFPSSSNPSLIPHSTPTPVPLQPNTTNPQASDLRQRLIRSLVARTCAPCAFPVRSRDLHLPVGDIPLQLTSPTATAHLPQGRDPATACRPPPQNAPPHGLTHHLHVC